MYSVFFSEHIHEYGKEDWIKIVEKNNYNQLDFKDNINIEHEIHQLQHSSKDFNSEYIYKKRKRELEEN